MTKHVKKKKKKQTRKTFIYVEIHRKPDRCLSRKALEPETSEKMSPKPRIFSWEVISQAVFI